MQQIRPVDGQPVSTELDPNAIDPTVTPQATEAVSATYTVKWLDLDEKELKSEVREGTAGEMVVVEPTDLLAVDGYTFVNEEERNIQTATLAADGSTELKLYFKTNADPVIETEEVQDEVSDVITEDVKTEEDVSDNVLINDESSEDMILNDSSNDSESADVSTDSDDSVDHNTYEESDDVNTDEDITNKPVTDKTDDSSDVSTDSNDSIDHNIYNESDDVNTEDDITKEPIIDKIDDSSVEVEEDNTETATYTVEWYDEELNLIKSETREGTLGEIVSATDTDKESFNGFIFDEESDLNKLDAVVNEFDSAVIQIYMKTIERPGIMKAAARSINRATITHYFITDLSDYGGHRLVKTNNAYYNCTELKLYPRFDWSELESGNYDYEFKEYTCSDPENIQAKNGTWYSGNMYWGTFYFINKTDRLNGSHYFGSSSPNYDALGWNPPSGNHDVYWNATFKEGSVDAKSRFTINTKVTGDQEFENKGQIVRSTLNSSDNYILDKYLSKDHFDEKLFTYEFLGYEIESGSGEFLDDPETESCSFNPGDEATIITATYIATSKVSLRVDVHFSGDRTNEYMGKLFSFDYSDKENLNLNNFISNEAKKAISDTRYDSIFSGYEIVTGSGSILNASDIDTTYTCSDGANVIVANYSTTRKASTVRLRVNLHISGTVNEDFNNFYDDYISLYQAYNFKSLFTPLGYDWDEYPCDDGFSSYGWWNDVHCSLIRSGFTSGLVSQSSSNDFVALSNETELVYDAYYKTVQPKSSSMNQLTLYVRLELDGKTIGHLSDVYSPGSTVQLNQYVDIFDEKYLSKYDYTFNSWDDWYWYVNTSSNPLNASDGDSSLGSLRGAWVRLPSQSFVSKYWNVKAFDTAIGVTLNVSSRKTKIHYVLIQ